MKKDYRNHSGHRHSAQRLWCQRRSDRFRRSQNGTEIAEYKSEIKDLEIKIRDLEKEIIANGGSLELPPDTVVVTTMTIERGTYEEFVEVAGSVSSDQNILVSSEMGHRDPHLCEGRTAGKCRAAVAQQMIRVAESIDELQNAYDLAKTVYESAKVLWDQKDQFRDRIPDGERTIWKAWN